MTYNVFGGTLNPAQSNPIHALQVHCISKKVYNPTTHDNFNSSRPIPIIFGTNITE